MSYTDGSTTCLRTLNPTFSPAWVSNTPTQKIIHHPCNPFILCECDNSTQPSQPSQRQFSSMFWKLQWAGSDHNNHWERHELQRYELSCASSPPCWAQGWVTRAWLSHLLIPDRCRKSRERYFRSHQTFRVLVHHHPSKGMWFQPANKTTY